MFFLYVAICRSIIVFQNVTYKAHMQNEWTDQSAYFYSVCTIELVMRKGKRSLEHMEYSARPGVHA